MACDLERFHPEFHRQSRAPPTNVMGASKRACGTAGSGCRGQGSPPPGAGSGLLDVSLGTCSVFPVRGALFREQHHQRGPSP